MPSDNELKEVFGEQCAKDSFINVLKLSETENSLKTIDGIVGQFKSACKIDSNEDLLVYILATEQPQRVKRVRFFYFSIPLSNQGLIKIFFLKASAPKLSNQEKNITNIAVFYSDQYPAMFNLLFWTSLILAIAVAGISIAMCSMDPGLDTVIYRMTSQRIKKDQ